MRNKVADSVYKIAGFVVCMAVAFPVYATAQARRASAASESSIIAANVLIGGASAGLARLIAHKPFLGAFARGSAAGATSYIGKRIIANEGPWAAWTGRSVAAIAASEIRNAETGKRFLQEVILPIGPGRLYAEPRAGRLTRFKIDLAAIIASVAFARAEDTRLNWSESLRNGAVVFNQPFRNSGDASHVAGVIRIEDIPANLPRNGRNYVRSGVLAHEIIHASQNDFAFITWAQPVEHALFDRKGIGHAVYSRVDFGLGVALWQFLNTTISHDQRPWEREAAHLAPGS